MLDERSPFNFSEVGLNFMFNPDKGLFSQYFVDDKHKLTIHDFKDVNQPPMIRTVSALKNMDYIKDWVFNGDPFILVGPEGCGKNLIIRNTFMMLKQTKKIQIVEISCNAQTKSA